MDAFRNKKGKKQIETSMVVPELVIFKHFFNEGHCILSLEGFSVEWIDTWYVAFDNLDQMPVCNQTVKIRG